MYVPEYFEESDVAGMLRLVRAHPLGTWVTLAGGELTANHIPFLVEPGETRFGTLVGHVARANPVWRALPAERDCLVVFQGPQAYISPAWYASKREDGKVVPTWNYTVVHAHGRARANEDREWLRQLVTRLSAEHESRRAAPWKVTDAPAEYVDSMLGAIVGIEIPIERCIGKAKVSQNQSPANRRGVVAGLRASEKESARTMADWVEERDPSRSD